MSFTTLVLLAGGGLLLQWFFARGGSSPAVAGPVPIMPADLAAPDVDTPRQGFAALLVVRGALESAGVPAAEIAAMLEPIAPHLLKQPQEVRA